MKRLPNCDRAILDIRKIEHYCLDLTHPRGRHKARIFREVFGINRSNATWLRSSLLIAVREADAVETGKDRFGTRWRVDVPLSRNGKTAIVRTLWIVRSLEADPRFVTCWVM